MNIVCDDQFVFFTKAFDDSYDGKDVNKRDGYKYSISENRLEYVYDEDLTKYPVHLDRLMDFMAADREADTPSDYMILRDKLCGNDEKNFSEGEFVPDGIEAYPRENDVVVFAYGHNFGDDNERVFKIYVTAMNNLEIIKSYDFDI